jgi:2-polyprenyl-3-methyl-5-hydroxy-6-metoxy-1,4-benzoquinol methylase
MHRYSSTPVDVWDNVADEYQETSYQGKDKLYPANSFRQKLLEDFFAKLPKGKILDAGCGTGEATRLLLRLGWDVTSVDYSPKMVAAAKRHTEKAGLTGKFEQCSLNELSKLNQTFPYIMLNGVLPYIAAEEEPEVFAQIAKVAEPGATLISSHYNAYFELFGFDKWSVATLGTTILPEAGLDKDVIALAEQRIASLLNTADEVLDQEKTMKFESPLDFGAKIKKFGFEQFDQAYYNFFYLPPKFEAEQDQKIRADMEARLNRTNAGLLLARTFVSFAKKTS